MKKDIRSQKGARGQQRTEATKLYQKVPIKGGLEVTRLVKFI